MNKTTTKKILKIVNENLQREISFSEIENDLSQLGMDSITFIRIIVALEEEFEVEVPDEYLLVTEMNTVSKMADVLFAAINTKAQE